MRYRPLVIYLMLGLLIAQVNGAYQSQTIDITDTEDDGFITESGNMLDDVSYIYTTEVSQDIRSFWVFHDVDIESSEKLNNATLRIRSGPTRDFDADNSFTLRGLELDNLQDSWRPLAGMILVLPQTSAYVNVNTSNYYGYSWHEIDVTDIVKEIINRYEWDGDAVGTGDSIGFIALGAQDDTRGFYDYSGNSAYSAELVIGYGEEPEPPPSPPPAHNESTWVFVNTTERVVINETTGETTEIDIFMSTPVGEWLNFSTFDVIGADSAKISGLNDTFFQVTSMYSDSLCWVARNYTDFRSNSSATIALKFGLIWEALPWSAGGPAYDYVNMWGVSEAPIDQAEDWTGYSYAERTWTNQAMGTAWSVDGGVLKDSTSWSPLYLETTLPWTFYYHIRLNMDTMTQNVSLFNDMAMLDLNVSYVDTFTAGPGNISDTLAFEYLISPFENALPQTIGFTGKYISTYDDLTPSYWLVWPNGTILDGPFDTEDEALEALDDLIGSDPGDPDPPGQGYPQTGPFTRFRVRLYILVLGCGCLIGPVLVFAVKKGSLTSGIMAGGFIVMLMGLGLMIAITQI